MRGGEADGHRRKTQHPAMATTAVAGGCLALLLGGLSLLLLGIVSACCGPVAAESVFRLFWLGLGVANSFI